MVFHLKYCRQLTAAVVFSVVLVYVSVPAALLLTSLELTICPARYLWFPKKRPDTAQDGVVARGAAAKRPRESPAVDVAMDEEATTEDTIGRSVPLRYTEKWWGYWKIRGAGPSFKDTRKALSSEEFDALCTLNTDACRRLLVGLEESELRSRLQQSPYKQDKMSTVESWLREAAGAFNVSLRSPRVKGERGFKTKDVLIEEVVRAVASAKTARSAPASSSRYSRDTWGNDKLTSKEIAELGTLDKDACRQAPRRNTPHTFGDPRTPMPPR